MFRSILSFICIVAFAAAALAGPGHDHGGGGHDDGAATASPEMARLESAGSELELVATGAGHTLKIYLDTLNTNEPVDGATIEVSGEGIAAVTAKPLGEGAYAIEADWVDQPGTKALNFLVTVKGTADLLNGILDVHEPAKADGTKPLQATDLFGRPEVWTIAALSGLIGFFLAFAFRPLRLPADTPAQDSATAKSAKTDRVELGLKHAAEMIVMAILLSAVVTTSALAGPGHDHGSGGHGEDPEQAGGNTPRKLPEGDVFVPKPSQRLLRVRTTLAASQTARAGTELVGTVMADPSSEGRVQAPMDGQIEIAKSGVPFVGQTVKAGDVLAILTPSIPVADRGTLQQLTAEVEGKLRIAEQRLSRLTRIAGVVPQKDIDDTRAELDALKEQRKVLAPKNAEKIQVKAPVTGIISVAGVRAGQVVNARDTLFEIVDPQRLWIEAIGIAGHDDIAISAAHALDGEGHSIPLSFIGRAPTLRQQAMPLLFKVDETHVSMSIGASIKVIVQRGKPVEGIVVPDAAVVRGNNGLPQVWTKVSAERFKAVPVRTTPLDGSRVLVAAGIEPGSRVVVEGAEFINQVR